MLALEAWFGVPGPIGKRSVFCENCWIHFFGPNVALCGSFGDLLTKVTVVPTHSAGPTSQS